MASLEYEVFRGDTLSIKVKCADAIANGGKIRFTAKEKSTDADDAALITKLVDMVSVDGAYEAVILLTPDDTNINPKKYLIDVQFSNSDQTVVKTIKGSLKVLVDISRTSP